MAYVLSHGSETTAFGFSGQSMPTRLFATHTPAPAHAINKSAPPAILRGQVNNWDALQELWDEVLAFEGEALDLPLITTDSPSTPDANRERTAEMAFERYGAPSYFVGYDAVMGVYSAGRISSVVFDVGAQVCHAMAVHEGFIFPHTLQRLEVGGADADELLVNLLEERDYAIDAAEAKEIKEKYTRMALDFAKEANIARTRPSADTNITLPDGTPLQLMDEHLRISEVLMEPSLVGKSVKGLGDIVLDVVNTCDAEREYPQLRQLSSFVLGIGGGSLTPGIAERVHSHLDTRENKSHGVIVSCLQQAERQYAAWIGASLLANLPGFVEHNFVSKAEYDEHGAAVIHKRC